MPLLTGLVVAGTGVEVRGALVIVVCFLDESVKGLLLSPGFVSFDR